MDGREKRSMEASVDYSTGGLFPEWKEIPSRLVGADRQIPFLKDTMNTCRIEDVTSVMA